MRALLLVAALFVIRPAFARAEGAARPEVELLAAGAPATLSAMQRRIRALESRLALRLRLREEPSIDVREVVARHAPVAGLLARVWLDLSDPERAVLFISNAGHDRLLVRVVPARGGYGELTQESLATILESALEALLAGGEIGVDRSAALREIEAQTGTRVEPPAALPIPPVVPAPTPAAAPAHAAQPAPAGARRTHSTQLSLGYRGDAIDAGALRHGAQLGLALSGFFAARCDLVLGLGGQYFAPFSLGTEAEGVTQHGGGARALVGITGRVGARFVWRSALGVGVDVARIEPTVAAESELQASAPFVTTLPIAGAYLSAGLRLAAWIELFVGVGLDVDLSSHHFDVQGASGRTRAISPWIAHPYWVLGLSFPLSRQAGAQG